MNSKINKLILLILLVMVFNMLIPLSSLAASKKTSISKATVTYTLKSLSEILKTDTNEFVTVTLKYKGKTLKRNKDYTLTFSYNMKNRTGRIVIKGIGSYNGSLTKDCSVPTASLNDTLISLSKTSCRYTGKAIRPDVTVKYLNTTLKKGEHYTVKYFNNTKRGIATVQIDGIGHFKGRIFMPFFIK